MVEGYGYRAGHGGENSLYLGDKILHQSLEGRIFQVETLQHSF